MRLWSSIFFLTFVLIGSAGHPAPLVDDRPAAPSLSPKLSGEPVFSGERLVDRNWSFRLGFLGGSLSETNKSGQVYYYGLRWDFLRRPYHSWQIELTTAEDNFIHLVLAKKIYFPLEEVTRPYYKFGIGELISSTNGLGSIFNLKKTQALAAVGLDDLFLWNRRLQAEIGLGYAIVGPQLEASLGFAF